MPKKPPIAPYNRPEKYKRNSNLSPAAAVICLIAVWYIAIGRAALPKLWHKFSFNQTKAVAVERQYYEFNCSEANFARLVAITLGDSEEIMKEGNENTEGIWYEKYYKQLEVLQIYDLKQEEAFSSLTGSKLCKVMEELFGSNESCSYLRDKQKLNLAEVIEVYNKVLQSKEKQINYESLAVLATPTDEVELEPWQLVSDQGKFYFEGLVVDPVKNQTIKVATWEHHLLGIVEIQHSSCCIQECKVTDVQAEQISFEVQGINLTYPQDGSIKEGAIGQIGALTIKNGKAAEFSTDVKSNVDTVVSITKNEISLEKAGTFTYGQINIYDLTGGNYTTLESLPYGMRVSYTAEGNKITSLEVLGESTVTSIRVVLTNKKQYEQKEVSLSGDADYDLLYGGKAETLSAGTVWKSEEFNWDEKDKVIRIVPRTDSLLTVTSLEKSEGAPSYKGIIEIQKTSSGYIIINEVNLEDYVAGVIPSEMPTSYGSEALKAQAVAARTYAASCLSSSKFISYSANVDDTTASQVYNQIPADKAAYAAAEATEGLVLECDGKLISNKFFAASCGYTANFGEVWAGQSFPEDSPSYLISRQQYIGDEMIGSLEKEENFKSFIELTAEDLDAFDEDSAWFRWKVNLTQEELQRLLIPALKKIGAAYPSLVVYESKAGIKQNEPISELGKLMSLKAEERGQGGNLMTLGIYAEKGNVKVSTEYLIRSLFASNENQGLTVVRSNQSRVNQMTLLPSAFFTIIENKDADGNLQSITLEGGGNGHGVGLSQDGAKGMAERGYNFKEILAHFYPDSDLVSFKQG